MYIYMTVSHFILSYFTLLYYKTFQNALVFICSGKSNCMVEKIYL